MKSFLLPVIVWIIPAAVVAQNTYSLEQAIDYAQAHSANAKNATVDVAIQQQKIKEVRSIGLPQVNADLTFQNFLVIPTTVVPATAFNPAAPPGEIIALRFGADYNVNAGVTVSQMLFDGSYFVGLKASKELMEMQVMMEEKTKHEIRVETMRAYYTAVVADENVIIIEASLQRLEKLQAETEAINKEGLIEKQDVDQFTLTVENMRNNLLRARNMRDLAYKALKLQMGMKVEDEIQLSQNASSLAGDSSAAAGSDFDVVKTYERMLLDQQLALSELNLKYKKSKALPSAGLFFTQQYVAQRFQFDIFENKPWYPTTVWGLKISVPIFGGGRLASTIQQNKLENEKIKNTIESVDQGLKLQATSAQLNLEMATQNLETQKKSMEISSDIEQKMLVKYKEGMAGSLELNQAQMQYLSAQGNYIQALLGLFSARCDIEKLKTEPTTK